MTKHYGKRTYMLWDSLWFNSSPIPSLMDRITTACKYYLRKYESQPTLILVNPDELKSEPTKMKKTTIKPDSQITLGQFLVTHNNKKMV